MPGLKKKQGMTLGSSRRLSSKKLWLLAVAVPLAIAVARGWFILFLDFRLFLWRPILIAPLSERRRLGERCDTKYRRHQRQRKNSF
jgi:hypothetical protein